MADELLYILFLYAVPSKDVPGQWVSWCPNLDVVSQGNDVLHALKMLREAVVLVVRDDLAANKDPRKRAAPRSEWGPLFALMDHGKRFFPHQEITPIEQVSAIVTCEDLLTGETWRFEPHSVFARFRQQDPT